LGINYKGKTGKPNQLRLLTSPLHPASDIDLRTGDNVQRAQLQGARAAGYFGAASNTHHSPAPAIDLGPAAPYNVLVFGDFSAPYADVEGRLAAGGDVSLNHYSVGAKLASSSAGDVLLVGGDLTFPSGRVYHGNIRVGGSAAGVGDPVRHGLAPGAELSEFTTLPMDFTSAEHTLKALSDDLARLPANGSAEFRWGGLTLHGDGHSALQVFTLDGAQVLQAHTFQVDGLPKEATVLFNITGTHPGLTHMSLDSLRYHRERTLFNFFEARTLTLAGIGVEGSILAPWATVTNPEGVIKGTLVAQAFDGALQLNHHPFLGHPSGDQDLVAVTTHDYGVGRSVYAGFDLLSEATVAHAPVFAKLLLNALKTVQPVDTLPVSGAVLPVHLGITNQGMATPVVVSLMASPADIRVVDALASRAETTSPATDQQRWVFALPESAEATLTTWWRLPDWEGLVTFDALVQTGSDPNLVDHALLSVDTDVQPRPTLSDAQAELMRLAAMDRTFDKVLKKLNKAAAKWSGGQVQYALKELLKVTEELARLAQPEAAEARRLVAQVLATVARQTLD
jgi:choice-of-anchor A domain-containing protein